MSGSSPRRRARRRRTARRLLLLAVVLAVTVGVVYVGIRDRTTGPTGAEGSSPSPSSTPSPSSSVDLSDLPIERGAFCDQLDQRNVEDALGGPVSDTSHYDSGDRVALAPGVTDVSHEYDCTFEAADGTEARVWVFAEPVTPAVGRHDRRGRPLGEGLHGPPGPADVRDAVGRDRVPHDEAGRPVGDASRAVRGRLAQLPAEHPRCDGRRRDGAARRPVVRPGRHHPRREALGAQDSVTSAPRRQRMPASRNGSMSPSNTACGLPLSYSVRRSLTSW